MSITYLRPDHVAWRQLPKTAIDLRYGCRTIQVARFIADMATVRQGSVVYVGADELSKRMSKLAKRHIAKGSVARSLRQLVIGGLIVMAEPHVRGGRAVGGRGMAHGYTLGTLKHATWVAQARSGKGDSTMPPSAPSGSAVAACRVQLAGGTQTQTTPLASLVGPESQRAEPAPTPLRARAHEASSATAAHAAEVVPAAPASSAAGSPPPIGRAQPHGHAATLRPDSRPSAEARTPARDGLRASKGLGATPDADVGGNAGLAPPPEAWWLAAGGGGRPTPAEVALVGRRAGPRSPVVVRAVAELAAIAQRLRDPAWVPGGLFGAEP